MKFSKAGIVLSAFAIFIASIALTLSTIEGTPTPTNVIVFFCSISMLFSNIAIYKSQKDKESHKSLENYFEK